MKTININGVTLVWLGKDAFGGNVWATNIWALAKIDLKSWKGK